MPQHDLAERCVLSVDDLQIDSRTGEIMTTLYDDPEINAMIERLNALPCGARADHDSGHPDVEPGNQSPVLTNTGAGGHSGLAMDSPKPDPSLLHRGTTKVGIEIDNLRYLLVSRPWSSVSRDGPRGKKISGYDGARAARVLAGVLLTASLIKSLEVHVSLEDFAHHVGIAGYRAIRDALQDLHDDGWIEFTLGVQDPFAGSTRTTGGVASKVRLLPKPHQGWWSLDLLPQPWLDPFQDNQTGHGGWLIMARVLFETPEGRYLSLGLSDIQHMTGMTYERVKRIVPKMAKIGLCRKVGRKYVFDEPEATLARGKYEEHQAVARVDAWWDKSERRRQELKSFEERSSNPIDAPVEKRTDVFDPVTGEYLTGSLKFVRGLDNFRPKQKKPTLTESLVDGSALAPRQEARHEVHWRRGADAYGDEWSDSSVPNHRSDEPALRPKVESTGEDRPTGSRESSQQTRPVPQSPSGLTPGSVQDFDAPMPIVEVNS